MDLGLSDEVKTMIGCVKEKNCGSQTVKKIVCKVKK